VSSGTFGNHKLHHRLSFALERIGPLATIIIIVFFYLLALSNTPVNPFASIYSESLIKTACQHLLLLVGFDTLIYWKYYDTPPILVGHQSCTRWRWKYWLHNRSKISNSSEIIGYLMIKSTIYSHREGFVTSWRKQPKDFWYWNSQTRLTKKLWFSSHVDMIKILNVMVAKIMKLRPQDPSCMA
jgi:hypothetical protein